jgi:hypothetical protein
MIQNIDDNLFCFCFFGFKKVLFKVLGYYLFVCCENLSHLF